MATDDVDQAVRHLLELLGTHDCWGCGVPVHATVAITAKQVQWKWRHYCTRACEYDTRTVGKARQASRRVRALVLERDGFRCVRCGAEEGLTMDHIVPWSKGGLSVEANLQTMCFTCNGKKGASMDGAFTREVHQ